MLMLVLIIFALKFILIYLVHQDFKNDTRIAFLDHKGELIEISDLNSEKELESLVPMIIGIDYVINKR